MPTYSATTNTQTLPPAAPTPQTAPTLPPSPRSPSISPLTQDPQTLDRSFDARYAHTTPSHTPRSPITSPLTPDPGTVDQHHTKRRSCTPSPSPPQSPSPLTQPDCVRLQPQTKRPCIEAHRLASENESSIEPLLKRPRTSAPPTHTPQTIHLQHPTTAGLPFVQLPAPITAAGPTPPSGTDVDQHDADIDEPATPFATRPDTPNAADDSPPLAECQGQAAAQQAKPTPRKKPADWARMNRTQKNHWFRRKG